MEKVDLDTILKWFRDAVENKIPISVVQWLDSAAKLNTLAEDLDNEIAHMESLMAIKRAELIQAGESATKADALKILVINFEEYKKKIALRNRINEHIMIAKKRRQIEDFS